MANPRITEIITSILKDFGIAIDPLTESEKYSTLREGITKIISEIPGNMRDRTKVLMEGINNNKVILGDFLKKKDISGFLVGLEEIMRDKLPPAQLMGMPTDVKDFIEKCQKIKSKYNYNNLEDMSKDLKELEKETLNIINKILPGAPLSVIIYIKNIIGSYLLGNLSEEKFMDSINQFMTLQDPSQFLIDSSTESRMATFYTSVSKDIQQKDRKAINEDDMYEKLAVLLGSKDVPGDVARIKEAVRLLSKEIYNKRMQNYLPYSPNMRLYFLFTYLVELMYDEQITNVDDFIKELKNLTGDGNNNADNFRIFTRELKRYKETLEKDADERDWIIYFYVKEKFSEEELENLVNKFYNPGQPQIALKAIEDIYAQISKRPDVLAYYETRYNFYAGVKVERESIKEKYYLEKKEFNIVKLIEDIANNFKTYLLTSEYVKSDEYRTKFNELINDESIYPLLLQYMIYHAILELNHDRSSRLYGLQLQNFKSITNFLSFAEPDKLLDKIKNLLLDEDFKNMLYKADFSRLNPKSLKISVLLTPGEINEANCITAMRQLIYIRSKYKLLDEYQQKAIMAIFVKIKEIMKSKYEIIKNYTNWRTILTVDILMLFESYFNLIDGVIFDDPDIAVYFQLIQGYYFESKKVSFVIQKNSKYDKLRTTWEIYEGKLMRKIKEKLLNLN